MKKIQHTCNGELLVHYDSPIGCSSALCGMDIVGDSMPGDEWDAAVPSKKRVNCRDCLSIRDHVLGKKNLNTS